MQWDSCAESRQILSGTSELQQGATNNSRWGSSYCQQHVSTSYTAACHDLQFLQKLHGLVWNTLVVTDIIIHDLVSGEEQVSQQLNTCKEQVILPVCFCNKALFRHAVPCVKVMMITLIRFGNAPHTAQVLIQYCYNNVKEAAVQRLHLDLKCMCCCILLDALKKFSVCSSLCAMMSYKNTLTVSFISQWELVYF